MKTIFVIGLFEDRNKALFSELCRHFDIIMFKNQGFQSTDFGRVEYAEDIIGKDAVHLSFERLAWQMYECARYSEGLLKGIFRKEDDYMLHEEEFAILHKMAVPALVASCVFKKLTEKVNIDMVVSSADYSGHRRPVVLEAKRMGIPTLNIEHGFYAMMPEYHTYTQQYRPLLPFISDYVNLDNEIEKNIWEGYYNSYGNGQKITFVANGTPNDISFDPGITKSEAASFLGLDTEKFTLTIAGSWIEAKFPSFVTSGLIDEGSFYHTVFETLASSREKDSLQIIIKLHPAYLNESILYEMKQHLFQQAGHFGVPIALITHENLSQIIAASDLMVCPTESSVLWEAFLANVPGIIYKQHSALKHVLRIKELNEANLLCRKGCLRYACAPDELLDAVYAYFNPENCKKYKATAEKIRRQKHITLETAEEKSRRICTWISTTLEKQNSVAFPATTHTPGLSSLVILTCNQIAYTRQCIESIIRLTRLPFELIIVDNGSKDGTIQYLEETKRKIKQKNCVCEGMELIMLGKNIGFAAGNNEGIARATGDYIIIMNNDVVVTPGWLRYLMSCAESDSTTGIAGPMTNYVSGPQFVSNVTYNRQTLDGLHSFAAEFSRKNAGRRQYFWRIVGFCMLIKKAVIQKIGGFDGRYGIGNFEDDDFCLRATIAGFKNVIARDCFVHHFGSRTFIGESIDYTQHIYSNWEKFKKKWGIPSNLLYHTEWYRNIASIKTKDVSLEKCFCPLKDPGSIAAGERLFEQGDYEGAKRVFYQLVSEETNNIEALNNLGVISFEEGNFEQAISFFKQALTIKEDYTDARENLQACMRAKDTQHRDRVQKSSV